jgi:hypothetical protein
MSGWDRLRGNVRSIALRHAEAVAQRDLRARDRTQAMELRAPGELHGAVQAVVIGEGERRIAELDRSAHQLVGVGGSVQEGEARMAVELDVGTNSGDSGGHGSARGLVRCVFRNRR